MLGLAAGLKKSANHSYNVAYYAMSSVTAKAA
jgi:hypothetical protein